MDFNNIDNKIEANLKQIEFYQNLYQRNQNKFSFLVLIYSFICFYIIELLKYPFKKNYEFQDFLYVALLFLFLFLLYKSLCKTYSLIKPINVAYLNQPKFFYVEILSQYKEKLKTDNDELLNEYVKTTYLNETEIVLENNIVVFKNKSQTFYENFEYILKCFLLYIFLSSFVIIQKKEDKTEIELKNYKEIINYKNSIKMSNEKPKVDPKLVITTTPVMIKESINMKMEKKDSTSQKQSTGSTKKKSE